MATFRGYRLIRLNKAVDATTGPDAYHYSVTIIDGFGIATDTHLSVSALDTRWTKLRMEGNRFAQESGGQCLPISETEFDRLNDVV
jgi:hypothetical protein